MKVNTHGERVIALPRRYLKSKLHLELHLQPCASLAMQASNRGEITAHSSIERNFSYECLEGCTYFEVDARLSVDNRS